jgi:hypothetical protein
MQNLPTSLFQAKLETKALKAKRPGFTDERYHETAYFVENGKLHRKCHVFSVFCLNFSIETANTYFVIFFFCMFFLSLPCCRLVSFVFREAAAGKWRIGKKEKEAKREKAAPA